MRSVPAASEVPKAVSSDNSFFDEPRLCAELIRVLQHEGSLRLRVKGSSMWPWVRSGAEVQVRSWNSEGLVPGDLVLFQRGSTLAFHRVVRRPSDRIGWIVRGDAHGSVEEFVSDDSVLGKGEGLVVGRKTWRLGSALERRIAHAILEYGPAIAKAAKLGMTVRRRVLGSSRR